MSAYVDISAAFGPHTYISENTHVSQRTTIGNYCSIANNVTIGAQQHSLTKLTTYPFTQDDQRQTIVEHDVWIGCNAVIMAGLRIGTGAVIGAGAVVTHDVPPYAIVYGVPARVVRFRFEQPAIDALLESKWWELPYEAVKNLPLDDPMECVEWIRDGKQRRLSGAPD